MSKANNKPFGELDIDEKINVCTSTYSIHETISKEEVYRRLSEKIDNGDTPTRNIYLRQGSGTSHRIFIYAAAAVILLIGCGIIMSTLTKTVSVPKGSHMEYVLADGSTVNINSDSQIKFKRYGFARRRNVELNGEAYFDVTSGTTFTVATDYGSITVLGTAFNVYARDNDFSVNCLRGKVKVDAKDSSVTLSQDESATLSGNELTFSKDETTTSASWITGEFFFENAPLINVINELERQFNIIFADIDNRITDRNFTGSFSNKEVDVALDIVCTPLGLEYEIINGQKIILKERK